MPDLWNFTVVMPMPLRPRLPHLNQVLASAGKGSGGDNAGTRELARPTHTLGMQHQPMHLERTGSFKTENSDSETEGGIEVSDLTAALETASAAPAAAPAAAQAQAPWGPAVIRDLPGRKKARKDAAGDDGLDKPLGLAAREGDFLLVRHQQPPQHEQRSQWAPLPESHRRFVFACMR